MEVKEFIRKNTWAIDPSSYGWGNGYVALPKEHPCYGIPYDKIKVRVHWGLTFGEYADNLPYKHWGDMKDYKGMYIVGFDTAHCDSAELFPTGVEVLEETLRLKEQLTSAKLFKKMKRKAQNTILKCDLKIQKKKKLIEQLDAIIKEQQ